MTSLGRSLVALLLGASGGPACRDAATPPDPVPLVRLRAVIINGTEATNDDLLVASVNESGPVATLEIVREQDDDGDDDVRLVTTVPSPTRIDPTTANVGRGDSAQFDVRTSSPSAQEGDLVVAFHVDSEDGPIAGQARLTAVGGVKIAFAGAFAFVTSNDNGARASSDGRPFTACQGEADPFIGRASPLACEGFSRINQMIIDEDQANARFDDVRPTLGLFVTELKTFDPVIDLAGRDPRLDVGTPVSAGAGRSGDMATIFTDDCDTPGDGTDAALLDPGLEPFVGFAVDVGGALSVAYDAETPSSARIWTRFPTPPTPADSAADLAAVDELLPDGALGCTSPNQTYFDVDGTFRCAADQNVRQLLQRNAGFRTMIARASADFTTRHVVAGGGGDVGAQSTSWVARLFRDASGTAPAEAVLRMNGFDWYTLTAFVERGVVSTPGGIDARFEELLVDDGCPATREPVVPVTDDPYAIDP